MSGGMSTISSFALLPSFTCSIYLVAIFSVITIVLLMLFRLISCKEAARVALAGHEARRE